MDELAPDTLILDRYRLERQLGAGGMGVVWSARQVVTRQGVALKFLRDPDSDPNTRKRFLREARAACAVHHANVVQIHDVIESEGMPIIVMELLEGESLGAKLRREKKLGVEELARLMLPVVSAVGTAHSIGIVHRDLKPDNIFLAKDADGGVLVKVLDFGVAKLTASDGDAEKTAGLTSTGTMVGTPYYMSPEQAFGERDIDHRSDIWALGIIFYQCLSGTLPTRAANVGQVLKIILSKNIPPLSTVVPDLPDDIAGLVARMLSVAREKRPADLREIQNVLRRHCDVPAASFGSAVAPPRSASKFPDSFSEDIQVLADVASLTSAATPAARAAQAQTPDAPPVDEDAPTHVGVVHEGTPTAGATVSDVARLSQSAAGSAKSVPAEPPAAAPRRLRARLGLAALAVVSASTLAIASREHAVGKAVALSTATPPATVVSASAVPAEPVAIAPSAAPPPVPAAPTTALPAASAARPAPTKKPVRPTPTASASSKPVDPPLAPSASAKPSAPEVFVNKPPF